MKIFSAQLKGTTIVVEGATASLTGSFTGSVAGIDINATNAFTASTIARLNSIETISSSNDGRVNSLELFTSSTSARLNSIETISASNLNRIGSLETISASNIARINSLETTSASVDSLNVVQNTRLSSLEVKTGSLATTGSNTFIGTQTITGSLYISSDLIVQGSSSLQNITASAVSIGTNIINLNTANPAIRYAGLVIGDSGSIGSSGSFFYDSVQDEMIFVHRGANTTVTSSVVLMGPQTYDSIGSETYLTSNRLVKGTGNEHIVDSNISDTGTLVSVNSPTIFLSGSVGIGTNSPLSKLHIGDTLSNSSDAPNALIIKQTSTNETTGIYLERSGERKGYYIYVGGSVDSLNFQRNNAGTKSDTLTLTRDGNVGINQTNPTGLGGPSLVVAGSGYPEVIVEKTGANARKWGFTVGSDGSYLLRDYTSGANVFTVNTSGAGNFNSNITVSGNTVWHSANDGAGSGLDADLLDGRDSGGYMTQVQGGIEFAQGSYTGWYKLARSSQAVGGAGLRGSFKIIVAATGNYLTPSQDEIIGFKDWTTNASISSIASTPDSIFQNYRITYDSDYSYLEGYVSYYFGGGQSIVINSYVNGLNGLTWTPYTGTVQASSTSSGAVSIGKVNNGFTVPYLRSAAGIKFGSGSGTLNYYEEGTFTPSSVGTDFSSISVVHGKYVRIGNQVTVNCKWTVTPGGTGRKYIVFNLPFAFVATPSNGFTGAVSNYNEGFSTYSSNVGTTVRNSSSSDTQQYVEAVYTSANANSSLQLMMTYFTF